MMPPTTTGLLRIIVIIAPPASTVVAKSYCIPLGLLLRFVVEFNGLHYSLGDGIGWKIWHTFFVLGREIYEMNLMMTSKPARRRPALGLLDGNSKAYSPAGLACRREGYVQTITIPAGLN